MPKTVYYSLLQVPKDVYYNINNKGMYGDMQLICDIFGQFDSSAGKPFLFRKEVKTSSVEFIIRSDIKPLRVSTGCKILTKEVPQSYFDKDLAEIKVTLNPIVQKAGQKNAKKVPLKSEEDIRLYVNKIFNKSGIEPVSIRIGKPVNDVGLKMGYRITVSKVDVEGIIKITDKRAFLDALESGVGAAKRFGCGLMLIK